MSIPKDVTHGRGYVYSLQYHIVWATKYRKPVFEGIIEYDVRKSLTETLRSLDIIGDVMRKNAIALYMTLIMLGLTAWNPSYFAATVSDRTLEQVKTYIDNQKTKNN